MNCKQVHTKLDSFVDGELNGDEMLAVRRHMSGCVCCSQEFQALRLLKKELSMLDKPEVDADFDERVLNFVYSQVAERPREIRRRASLAACFVGVSAIAALAAFSFASETRAHEKASLQSNFELRRDEAFVGGHDQLNGGTFVMPAAFERR